jgi:hypothetical protein
VPKRGHCAVRRKPSPVFVRSWLIELHSPAVAILDAAGYRFETLLGSRYPTLNRCNIMWLFVRINFLKRLA